MGRRQRSEKAGVYQVCWVVVVAFLHLGGWWGAVALSLSTVFILFGTGVIVGGRAVLVRRLRDRPAPSPVSAWRACSAVAGAGLSAVAIGGLLRLVGGAVGLTLILVVTAASPYVFAAAKRRLSPMPRAMARGIDTAVWALACSNPGPVPFQPTRERRQRTDEELCRAWCATYEAMHASPSRRKRLALVEERRAILDELARRNSAAFLAWLVEAGPGDNPWPYMRVDNFHRTVINWDELIGGSDPT